MSVRVIPAIVKLHQFAVASNLSSAGKMTLSPSPEQRIVMIPMLPSHIEARSQLEV